MKNDNNVCGVCKCAIQHGNTFTIVIDVYGYGGTYVCTYVYYILLSSCRSLGTSLFE